MFPKLDPVVDLAKSQKPSNHNPAMASPLRQLLALLSENIDALEKACADGNVAVPDLYEPFSPSSEAFRAIPAATYAAKIISAAAGQIDAIVTPPQVSLYHAVGGVRSVFSPPKLEYKLINMSSS